MPQVGQDGDTAPFQLGGLRVLVLVDHVLVDTLGHQQPGLGLHPGRDEGGEVQPGAAVEQQLVVDELVGNVGRNRVVGQLRVRRRDGLAVGRIRRSHEGVGVLGMGVTRRGIVKRHGLTIPECSPLDQGPSAEIVDAAVSRQREVEIQVGEQATQHMTHAVLSAVRQPVHPEPSDEYRLRAQRQRLDDVAAGADPGVEQHLDLIAHGLGYRRQRVE